MIVIRFALCDSFCDSQSDLQKFLNRQWQSSTQLLFLQSQREKQGKSLDQGGTCLHTSGFKRFVPFFRTHFTPYKVCKLEGVLQEINIMAQLLVATNAHNCFIWLRALTLFYFHFIAKQHQVLKVEKTKEAKCARYCTLLWPTHLFSTIVFCSRKVVYFKDW